VRQGTLSISTLEARLPRIVIVVVIVIVVI